MELFKRIKRLIELSKYDILMPEDSIHGALPAGSQVTMIVKKPQQLAKIIRTVEPIDEFLEEPKHI